MGTLTITYEKSISVGTPTIIYEKHIGVGTPTITYEKNIVVGTPTVSWACIFTKTPVMYGCPQGTLCEFQDDVQRRLFCNKHSRSPLMQFCASYCVIPQIYPQISSQSCPDTTHARTHRGVVAVVASSS